MTDAAVGTTSDEVGSPLLTKISGRPSGPLRTILPFVLKYWKGLLIALLFLMVSTIATLAIPASLGSIIQEGFIERNIAGVGRWSWMILAMSAVIAVGSGARFYLIGMLGERILIDLRQAVFAHLLSLDVAFYDAHRVGELTSRLNSDVAAIRGAVGSTVTVTVRGVVVIVGALVMMLTLSPLLALAVLVGGPLAMLPILLLSRRLKRMSRRAQDAVAELSAMATEMLGANRTVKSFNQEQEQARRYRSHGAESLDAESGRLLGRAVLIAAVTMVAATALVAIVVLGANAVSAGQLTVGGLAQFLIYALMASGSLTSLAEVMGSLQTVAGSTERLAELLARRPTVAMSSRSLPMPLPAAGGLRFENVSFQYTGVDRPAVEGLSFSVDPGTTVALVGASGAGKSTIFALLQRFYDVGSGSIEVDGLDVRQVEARSLRARIASVEQDPTIFAGSIADNIRFGRFDAADAEVALAASMALVTEFSDLLADRLETVVGERGVRLSGGQRQRIAIARAMLKGAPILLLDEATSALDSVNEKLVQGALQNLRVGRTTLIIAHRLSTIRNADEILVIDRGRIVDRGTHDVLVAKSGLYETLVRLQFSGIDGPTDTPWPRLFDGSR